MNRNLLFLFFFLASISVINAVPHLNKRATEFQECEPIPGNTVDVTALTVAVDPDPIVSNNNAVFTISGTAKEDIPSSAEISIVYNTIDGHVIGTPFFAPLCGNGDPCPVKKGDAFTRKLTAEAPALPTAYTVTIIINTTDPELTFGCTTATVGA